MPAGRSCSELCPRNCPSSRMIARMMTIACDQLSMEDAITVATIESSVPTLVEARDLLNRFQAMIRQQRSAEFSPWLRDASTSFLTSFASGLRSDGSAIVAALVEPWSNGTAEGQITKLKLAPDVWSRQT